MAGPLLNTVHANSAYSNTLLHSLDIRYAGEVAEGELFSTRFQLREESGKSSNAKLLPAKGGCSRIEVLTGFD